MKVRNAKKLLHNYDAIYYSFPAFNTPICFDKQARHHASLQSLFGRLCFDFVCITQTFKFP